MLWVATEIGEGMRRKARMWIVVLMALCTLKEDLREISKFGDSSEIIQKKRFYPFIPPRELKVFFRR